jgi:Flp pilus assembly protein TadG
MCEGLHRLAKSDRGAQILEFALALPLLVVFVVAIYDFGQAFNVKEKLNFAAKDGARLGATQPTNDLSQSIPASVMAIRDLVDADLAAAGINDCGLGPPIQLASTLVWTAKGICVNNSTFILKIDRGFTFNTSVASLPEPINLTATHVDISYPYQWHLNSVIKLIAPNSTPAGTTQIDTDAIAANQD